MSAEILFEFKGVRLTKVGDVIIIAHESKRDNGETYWECLGTVSMAENRRDKMSQ